MRVALFVPCYVDQLAPEVAWAAVELLEAHGCQIDFRRAQTCCGQLLLNAGDRDGARELVRRALDVFDGPDPVVAPSASCVATLRRHAAHLLGDSDGLRARVSRVYELCEFLVEVLGVERLAGRFPARVGLHPSCHGLRELRLGASSERGGEGRDPARLLLTSLAGLELVEPARADECCGFGGSFAVSESAVSCLMGRDRLAAHRAAGAEIVSATDVSCLLHLAGLARREGTPLRTLHVARILAESLHP